MARLVVIGIDGMDPDVVEKIHAKLPNLSSIMRAGGFKRCASVFPPDSIPAWVTIYTGEYPEKHGWLDNIDYEDIRKGADVGRQCELHGRTFWDLLGEVGKRVCVINPLMAYPVWQVNGVMVNGPVFITGEKQTYPPELAGKYPLPELGGMTEFPAEGKLDEFLEDVLRSTRQLADYSLKLMCMENWDLFFTAFFTLDRVQHFLWRYWDPSDPLYPGHSDLENSIERAYQAFDEIVGNFIQQLDAETGLLVLSDHGHGQRPTMLVNLNELLRQQSILKTAEGTDNSLSMKKAVEKTKNSSIKLVVWLLGERWLYRIGRLMPKRMRKALKKSSYLLDRENSTAWVSDLGGGASVGGIVIQPKMERSSQEYKDVARKIIESLDAIVSNQYGKVVKWAKLQDVNSLYPDIIFELEPHFSVGRSFFCSLLEENPRHRIISGGHKKEGVLFMRFPAGQTLNIGQLSDVSGNIISYLTTP